MRVKKTQLFVLLALAGVLIPAGAFAEMVADGYGSAGLLDVCGSDAIVNVHAFETDDRSEFFLVAGCEGNYVAGGEANGIQTTEVQNPNIAYLGAVSLSSGNLLSLSDAEGEAIFAEMTGEMRNNDLFESVEVSYPSAEFVMYSFRPSRGKKAAYSLRGSWAAQQATKPLSRWARMWRGLKNLLGLADDTAPPRQPASSPPSPPPSSPAPQPGGTPPCAGIPGHSYDCWYDVWTKGIPDDYNYLGIDGLLFFKDGIRFFRRPRPPSSN